MGNGGAQPASAPAVDLRWDPSDPAFRADPWPFYDRLRAECPAWRTGTGSLVLTRYDDVLWTLRSPDFSRDIQKNGPPPPPGSPQARRPGAKTILNLDPPDHTRLRKLVSRAFTPAAVERLRPRVQQLVDEALDVAAERGEVELIADLAFPVPFQVISDLLGMPTDRADEVREWAQALTASLEPDVTHEVLDKAQDAIQGLVPFLLEVIEDRRRNLGDDVLSGLIVAEEEGDRLSTEELISFVVLLYVAGHETTVNLIGNGALALVRNPDERRRWREDPSLDANAVDELLRYDPPVHHTVRVPMKDVTYRWQTPDGETREEVAPAGSLVMTVLAAANRDPAVFEEPARLRLDRENANRHVAFSSGVHHCLGASLARLEGQVALGTLVRRFPEIELAGEVSWRDRTTIRGVDRLPLALRPA